MLSNITVLSMLAVSTSLITTSLGAPVNRRQSIPCPAGTQYYDFETTSGFKGCTVTPTEFQNGPRKYWQSCPPAHGNWYVCATGFKGCTTDSTICDPKSSAPVPVPGPIAPPVIDTATCPTGQNYYVCATGFKGCSSDITVCDRRPIAPSPAPIDSNVDSNDTWSCPTGQTYYNCATGFKGCSWDHTVCDPKTPVQPKPIDPPAESLGFCPVGTSYYDFESASGFKGCTSTPEVYQNGPRVLWGSCPAGLGNWFVCANGFKGCNTNTSVCDLKA
ncbi:hypothetical protein VTL71DRAFT_13513 [Oculimacula yallundae]|uniref:Uncharacterized protein n=1 Tax=Oculimacula yallundae TaxID=86028 RepID=A0ABR4CLV7_9HELO